jgi:hypothetical protein
MRIATYNTQETIYWYTQCGGSYKKWRRFLCHTQFILQSIFLMMMVASHKRNGSFEWVICECFCVCLWNLFRNYGGWMKTLMTLMSSFRDKTKYDLRGELCCVIQRILNLLPGYFRRRLCWSEGHKLFVNIYILHGFIISFKTSMVPILFVYKTFSIINDWAIYHNLVPIRVS